MERQGKRGSLGLLRSHRWAGEWHREEETPQPATLHTRDLNRDHSRISYELHEESGPKRHHRNAQKDSATCRGMAQINLTFSLLTFQHRQLRWSRSPLGPGANNDTPPWVILRLIAHSQIAAWVHDMGTSKKACLKHTFRGRTLQSGENLISRWMDGYKERQGTERNLYWPLNDPNENRVECRVEGLFF